MIDHACFQQHAQHMARRHAATLLRNPVRTSATVIVAQAAQLITDCVRYLDLPALAVEVALGLHAQVKQWAAWGAWVTALDALLALPDDAYSVSDRIQLLHYRNHAACELGDHGTAASVAQRALCLAKAQGDQARLAGSFHEAAVAAYYRDDVLNAHRYWTQAYDLGAAHLKADLLGHICMNLGLIAEHHGHFDDALHHFAQAWEYYQTEDNAFHLVKLQHNVANVHRAQGHRAQAVASLQTAAATAHSIGAMYECGLITNTLGYVCLELGQYAAAQHAFARARNSFDQVGSLSGTALVLSNMAELYVTTAQWHHAAVMLHDAREFATVCNKPLLVAAVDVDAGRMQAAQGEHQHARKIWEGALAVQEAHGALHAARHTRTLIDQLPSSCSEA
jgi:tetratricopeptide (TPR) repeat protein